MRKTILLVLSIALSATFEQANADYVVGTPSNLGSPVNSSADDFSEDISAGGWEIFRFRAVSTGQMSLQLVYHRPWEGRVEPLQTFTLQVVVP